MNNKRVLWLLSLLLVASLVFGSVGIGAAQDEEIVLRWRTRPDNQEEADVYQSISDSLALEGITLEYEPGGSETAFRRHRPQHGEIHRQRGKNRISSSAKIRWPRSSG